MTLEKVHFDGARLALLVTLYGKAMDSRMADSILHDTYADEVLKKIDYDVKSLRVPDGADVSLPVRAKHFDGWTREFLAAHPNAVVLHLGCGLDSRVLRVDPAPSVLWHDVDLPEVIDLRRRVYLARPNVTLIGASVTERAWLEQIPADRPVLAVAAGLAQHLSKKSWPEVVRHITEPFPNGQVIFDAYSSLMVRLVNSLPAARGANVKLTWGVSDPHELERLVPGLALMDAEPFLTMPELVERLTRLSRARGAISGFLGRFQFMKRAVQHFRYRFDRRTPSA